METTFNATPTWGDIPVEETPVQKTHVQETHVQETPNTTLSKTSVLSDDSMTTQEMNQLARNFAANPESNEIVPSRVALAFAMCNQERKALKAEVAEKNQAIIGLNQQLTTASNLTVSQQKYAETQSTRLEEANAKVYQTKDELLSQQKEITNIAVANTSYNGALTAVQTENAHLHKIINDLQEAAAKQKVLFEALEVELAQTRSSLDAAIARESSGKKKTPNNASSRCHPRCEFQGTTCHRNHSSSS